MNNWGYWIKTLELEDSIGCQALLNKNETYIGMHVWVQNTTLFAFQLGDANYFFSYWQTIYVYPYFSLLIFRDTSSRFIPETRERFDI